MICLMDAESAPAARETSKTRRGRKKDEGVRCRLVAVLGMRAVHITIEQFEEQPGRTHSQAVLNRIGTAAGLMRRHRAATVLFSENFPYRGLVLGEGFMEADERTLMETLAGAIAGKAARSRRSAVLFTDCLTSGAMRTLLELCQSFRTVMLVSGSGADTCRALGRQLGISVVANPPAGYLKDADAAVFFSAPSAEIALSEKTVAIPTGPGALDGVTYRAAVRGVQIELAGGTAGRIPEGFAPAPLVSAALASLSLDREAVRLSSYELVSPPHIATRNDLTK